VLFTAVITARSSLADKPPRLALRFAVYTGLALVVVAVAMLWVLERDVEARAEQRAVAQTQEVAEATLRRHLAGSDFGRPVTPSRRRALDMVFDDIVVGGFVRATLYNRTGRVTYSTERSLRPSRYVLRITATGPSGKVTRHITFRAGRL
jgi:hypothetical protein